MYEATLLAAGQLYQRETDWHRRMPEFGDGARTS